jgi:hypothetical protein
MTSTSKVVSHFSKLLSMLEDTTGSGDFETVKQIKCDSIFWNFLLAQTGNLDADLKRKVF